MPQENRSCAPAMPDQAAAHAQMLDLTRRLRTPKGYLGWSFAVLVPVGLTGGALGDELRVLGLAITGSVCLDLLFALAIGLALERLRRDAPARLSRHPWRGLLARRRPPASFWPSGAI